MKKLLVLLMALTIAVVAVGCNLGNSLENAANDYFAEDFTNPMIDWTDLFAKMDAGDEPFILSIRQDDVYSVGHVAGAYRASWGTELAEKVAMLPIDEPVYVYCYSGQTAGQAVALLKLLGIDAYSVKSGYNYGAMKTEGYEAYVETIVNELPDAGAKLDAKVLEFVEDYFNAIPESGSNIMASDAASPLIDAGDLTVIDIRKVDDYNAGHIDGAINIPFGADMDFTALPEGKLIVACYSGQTAGQTVAVLRALGYDAVSLKFGMGSNGWLKYATTTAANKYFAEGFANPMITWEALFEKMDAEEDLNIVSIRQQDVYDAGHIKGAVLASWGSDLAAKISMLPTDEPVYVYCYSGQTAGQTVAMMRMIGIDAYSIKSGYDKGAMTVDGYEAYTTTDATEITDADATFDSILLAAAQDYFTAVGVAENGSFKIGWDDAQTAVEAETATVIDIRKVEDFATSHIVGAINIPFGAGMDFSELPAGKLIIACYSGQTSGQTTAVLRMLGHDAVSLHYGMKVGWIAEGYPVVTD